MSTMTFREALSKINSNFWEGCAAAAVAAVAAWGVIFFGIGALLYFFGCLLIFAIFVITIVVILGQSASCIWKSFKETASSGKDIIESICNWIGVFTGMQDPPPDDFEKTVTVELSKNGKPDGKITTKEKFEIPKKRIEQVQEIGYLDYNTDEDDGYQEYLRRRELERAELLRRDREELRRVREGRLRRERWEFFVQISGSLAVLFVSVFIVWFFGPRAIWNFWFYVMTVVWQLFASFIFEQEVPVGQ